MGATVAHRAPERMADGTCTQVREWMANKCKRRMNEGGGYIISKISQVREGMGGLLGSEGSWEFTSSDEESFSLGT